MLELGILKTWNSTTYKAGVQLVGSLTTYLDDISVSVSIPSSAMVVGNYVLVAIPGGNPRDACVVASWPAGSSGGGGGGGAFYALDEVTCIWRAWDKKVSDTPRTAIISSIAGDVITLTGNGAYRFGDWGAAGEYMHKDSVLVKIQNTTKAQFAWLQATPAANQLQVTNAADISTWQNGDTVSTSKSGVASTAVELDISPLIPDGATMVFLKTQCLDTGTIGYATGLQASEEGVAGTWCNTFCQVTNLLICAYPSIPVQSNRHINVRDRATGTDTLQHSINVVAYIK